MWRRAKTGQLEYRDAVITKKGRKYLAYLPITNTFDDEKEAKRWVEFVLEARAALVAPEKKP